MSYGGPSFIGGDSCRMEPVDPGIRGVDYVYCMHTVKHACR